MKSITRIFIALLLFAVTAIASGHSFSEGDVTVTHPWSRPTPPGVSMGVGYMAISNDGSATITLVGVTTPKAESVSIHESVENEGMMSMRPLPDGLAIPAGETVLLEPHGYHLMLEGLKGAVAKDERIPMTLDFDTAESMEIELHTMPMNDAKDSGETKHHH